MKVIFRCFVVLSVFTLIGCTGTGDNVVKEDIKFHDITSDEKEQIKDVIYNMPSPMLMSMMLKDAKAIYMSDVMNPVENEMNYYSSNYITALNLGIYGADLGYACAYIQVQDAFDYLGVSRNMAKNLKIYGAFEDDMVERFQENLGDRDSIMNIVGEALEMTDKYLKENERSNVSAMIVAGSWIEGLYLSTKVVQNYPTNMEAQQRNSILAPITKSIAEQKSALKNLMSLLGAHQENKDIERLIGKLSDLEKAYKDVVVEEAEGAITNVDAEQGVTTIGNETVVKISPNSLTEITIIIDNIRNSLTGIQS